MGAFVVHAYTCILGVSYQALRLHLLLQLVPSPKHHLGLGIMILTRFIPTPDLSEPAGTKVMKKMGTEIYIGVLLETYHGPDNDLLFRGIFRDALVSLRYIKCIQPLHDYWF